MQKPFTRRTLLTGTASACAVVAAGQALDLKPGEFEWHPEAAPEGPVAVIASLPDQLVHVYRNEVRIGRSTCSTGKPGHSTPTGIFTILQKDAHHHSSTYNNAPMPNMNRLTWSGVALHAGNLPGYPASHGCVRLPLEFSKLLFSVTHVGTPVIIADLHSQPADVVHAGPMLSAVAEHEMEAEVAKLAAKAPPPRERREDMQQPVSLLVSAADREIYIIRDGHILTKGPVEIVGAQPLGSHMLVLTGAHDNRRSLKWSTVGFKPDPVTAPTDTGAAVLNRLKLDTATTRQVIALMHPGLVMAVTDQPAHPDTRTGRDFVIMTHEL